MALCDMEECSAAKFPTPINFARWIILGSVVHLFLSHSSSLVIPSSLPPLDFEGNCEIDPDDRLSSDLQAVKLFRHALTAR